MLRNYEIRAAETEAVKAVVKICEWLHRFDLPRDLDISQTELDRVGDEAKTRTYRIDIRDAEIDHFLVNLLRGDDFWAPFSATVHRKNGSELRLCLEFSKDRGIVIRSATGKIPA